jgi:sterol desaturase/sphingolipid hydroxylase (fatty acid hydroxylase superfamily)
VSRAVCIVALFGAGLFSWTFLEYAIHGWMGHRCAGLVHSVHQGHHRDPSAVFAIGAWIPAILPLVLGTWFGAAGWPFFYAGMLTGFASYELLHYRMHFSPPLCRTEARLRRRHMVHHYCAADRCFGVTTSFWDEIFGTGISAAEHEIFASRIASIRPLRGRSNIRAPGAVMRRFVGALGSR